MNIDIFRSANDNKYIDNLIRRLNKANVRYHEIAEFIKAIYIDICFIKANKNKEKVVPITTLLAVSS